MAPYRHVGERPGPGHEPLAAKLEGNLTFDHLEAFLFSTVDVRRWPAARRHDRLPQGVVAIGILAHGKEAV